MRTNMRCWATMAAGMLGLLGMGVSAAAPLRGTIDTLATTGANAPGGGQYFDFSLLKLNDAGQVAFQSIINSNFTDSGIFRAQRHSHTRAIIKTGQSVGNGVVSTLSIGDLNNTGNVLFQADLTGTSGGSTDDRALYLGSGPGLQQVIREGASFVPDNIVANRFDFRLTSLEEVNFFEGSQLNDHNQVTFIGDFSAKKPIINGTMNVFGTAGMRFNPDGTVKLAYELGNAAPQAGGGTLGTFESFEGAVPLPFKTAIVNNLGHMLVRAQSGGPLSEGFYWTNAASFGLQNRVRAVGRDGQTLIPGAPGTIEVLTGTSPLVASHGVDMNDVGEVAFVPQLKPFSPGSPQDLAVYRWSPSDAAQPGAHGLTEIARRGTPVPGGDGQIGHIFFAEVELNNAGQTIFQSSIINSSNGSNDQAVFRGDGDELSVMVRNNMPTPDGQLFFGLLGSSVLANDIGINDAGHVAFHLPLRDEFGNFAGHGIYLTDGIDMIEVARNGSSLGGSTVTSLNWFAAKGINKHGQVAFNANLADGRDGVFLFTPDKIDWRSATGGSWDDANNWTLTTTPGELHHLYIRSKTDVAVDLPSSDVTVNSLRIGDNEKRGTTHEVRVPMGATLRTLQSIVLEPSARVVLELGGTGTGEFGRLVAEGDILAAGTLQVTLAEGFEQAAGQQFQLLTANSLGIFGEFEGVKLPEAADGLIWSTDRLLTHGLLVSTFQADFDEDGDVDAADYSVWSAGSGLEMMAKHRQGDANGDGAVNGMDMLVWQQQLGSTAPAPGAFAQVPEPGSLLAGVLLCGMAAVVRRRRAR